MSTMNLGLAGPVHHVTSTPPRIKHSKSGDAAVAPSHGLHCSLAIPPLILADAGSLTASVMIATLIAHAFALPTLSLPAVTALMATWLASNLLVGLYPRCGLHPVVELRLLCLTNTISLTTAAMWNSFATSQPLSLLVPLAIIWLMNFLFAPPARVVLRGAVERLLLGRRSVASPGSGMFAAPEMDPLDLLWPSIEKRVLDLILAVTVGILLLPCILLIAIASKATSPGPLLLFPASDRTRRSAFFCVEIPHDGL